MKSKKILAIILAALMVMPTAVFGAGAEDTEYTIVSPYEDVIWDGEGEWGAYKGTLHTHTTYSDADLDLSTMINGYYNRDYDFVANADHGVTGVEWNREPARVALYLYHYILGNKVGHLNDADYEAISNGTYPLENGAPRNKKMVCITGANEFGYITLTKSHVNGFFLPESAGNAWDGGENSYEGAVEFIDKNGGLSHIDHPGDWLETNKNPEAVNDPENIKYFGDIIVKYGSCLGTEVFNEKNGTTGYDRVLWDNLLMYCLPYGKNVIGFSNTDAHHLGTIDTSFSVFMMKDNTMDNVRETMKSGAFFAVTRRLRSNYFEIGPSEEIKADNTELPYPMFSKLTVDGHSITAGTKDATQIQFIANGKVIAKKDLSYDQDVTINLDEIEGAEDFLYVRAELLGEGGMCLSQALVIDNGSEPLTLEEESGFDAFLDVILFKLKSTRLYVIFQELFRLIG